MHARTTFLVIMLVTAVFSVVDAQRVVPPGQAGKINVPPGQIRRQFTYGHLKKWLPLLTGFLGCFLGTFCCFPIGNLIGAIAGYLIGSACIRPDL